MLKQQTIESKITSMDISDNNFSSHAQHQLFEVKLERIIDYAKRGEFE